MMILALDPGPAQTGWVCFDGESVLSAGTDLNEQVLVKVAAFSETEAALAIEMVSHYGMPVGREVFETCLWIGRFIERWGGPYTLVERRQVKLELCNSSRAKDTNVRQALINRIGPIGTKKNPGPTYGCKGHIWAALAVAVVAIKPYQA